MENLNFSEKENCMKNKEGYHANKLGKVSYFAWSAAAHEVFATFSSLTRDVLF